MSMHIQVVNFNLEELSHEDYSNAATDLAPAFNEVKGLISKVWLSDEDANIYGGIYTWENRQSMEDYVNSQFYDEVLGSNPSLVNITSKDYAMLEGPTNITNK